MSVISAYHVVTDRPMQLGQRLIFDETHHNGVYDRVHEKRNVVNEIYANPEKYHAQPLEHHTQVALREMALEKVRRRMYSDNPSRLSCLYVSQSIEEAEKWAQLFVCWGRPTYSIVRLEVMGRIFTGNANHCFNATVIESENLLLAQRYWENAPDLQGIPPIKELLADGTIEVVEMIKEINANVQNHSETN